MAIKIQHVEKLLSDGSAVYDLLLTAGGSTVRFECHSEYAAITLAGNLQTALCAAVSDEVSVYSGITETA